MSDVFREVDEDIAEDQRRALLKRYGPYAALAVTTVIAVVGGRELWAARQEAERQASATEYVAGVETLAGDLSAGAEALRELAENGPKGYSALARMQIAGARNDEGDKEGAAAAYEALAADNAAPELLRDVARVRLGYVLLDLDRAASARSAVAPLLNRNSRYRPFAQEIAGLAAYEEGDFAGAREAFQALAFSIEAPAALRDTRAPEYLALAEAALAMSKTPSSAAAPEAAQPVETAPVPVDAESLEDTAPETAEEVQ
ncbi:MAG: tetratricopeptide repeat protein [Pseudomonadota bacterium]